ncbi:MAG: DUF1858 domain-containing protein [Gemmatimonadetes bacterium]|nr:MAG: DUF1858 domain-containing protein [Gemmatimonadota bacterium]
MAKITADTYIEEIVENYPQLIQPLRTYNIRCLACGDAIWGTLGEAAAQKGIKNLDEILEEMNRLLEENP